jgi:hypothetical protein
MVSDCCGMEAERTVYIPRLSHHFTAMSAVVFSVGHLWSYITFAVWYERF